jgi:predicted negative regulator of RcsB-dependent stress response
MAAYDLEEQEQIAAIKDWWNKYGNFVLTVVIVILVAFTAWQGWRWYHYSQASQAAVLYSAIEQASQKNEGPKAQDAADQLAAKFSGTAYAPRGALLAAKLAFDAGDRATAKKRYQWVIDNASEDELKQLARLRLATVLLDEKQYDQALQTLDAKHDEATDGLYSDLKGDILVAAGKPNDAKAAYSAALAKLDSKSPYRNYVQVKLEALGGGTP